ncbi:MAG: glycosyltransferase family 2 protein [Candidatus Omnitrophota bacterium]|jgi:glycosyltransferase involved in cell wall biosynthesis|nr:MAG: glycosyltransferase family 2 protein [Candidatus Omnitrophota bacterium]
MNDETATVTSAPTKCESKRGYSVIVPVFNGEKTLPDTLRSLFLLKYDPFEVLVVDDGSTDRSAEIARAAGARVISLACNSGPAAARNRGALEAAYDTLLFTDSDVLLSRGLLAELDNTFSKTQADAVQGTFSEVCPYANYFSQYKNLYNRYVLNQLPDWIDTTFTSVTAVKRDAFLQCGGFDERIRTASIEDRTLGRHLRRRGYRIFLDRGMEVIHNKRLTFAGFVRNQYRRSRDLAKFLLRSRAEKTAPAEPTVAPMDEHGRFGTNAPSTMLRIPIVYAILPVLVLSCFLPVFGIALLPLLLSFLYLILPFEMDLVKRRGIGFALKGIFVNFLDAIVSGWGVFTGIFEFIVCEKRY